MVRISTYTPGLGERHVTSGHMRHMHIHVHMHACSPHTRPSAPLGCLEWKHSQGWRGKSGKHFFRRKQKNTSRASCYCTVLGRCFVCSDNSRTFKWRPGTEPETRAHHWRWGEKVCRPPCVCVSVCLFVCVSLECVSVCTLTGRHTIVDPHDYKVRVKVGVYIYVCVYVCVRGTMCDCVVGHAWAQACTHDRVCVLLDHMDLSAPFS